MRSQCYMGAAMILMVSILLLTFSTLGMAFPLPERLDFEISYAGVPAGRAVQQVSRVGNELFIVSTARSADWLKYFFPVEDRIESVLASAAPPQLFGATRLYRERIREGWTRFQKDAVFDRHKLLVTTKDLLKKTENTQKITPQTYDMLSSFFHVRTIPLQVGTSTYIDIFDCKKLWNTEIQVLRREEIEIPLGRFKTIVIKPVLKSEGIFARTGDMFIWLSDDDRRIPVQMKSKVRVGSITVTLVGGNYWPEKK
ncbi:MAG: DUF3108 domain-containing protein [Desulfuromonadales bacterium]|nr:DUF3108 domain-containing protein [Desulfuromonadales bacterium]